MKKIYLLIAYFFVFVYTIPVFAMPAKHIILAVAPNVSLEVQQEPFVSMPYKAMLTAWDVDVYEHWSGGVAFEPVGFDPSNGYNRDMDLMAIAPSPETALAGLLTGMKWRQGAEVSDLTIIEILEEKKGYGSLITENYGEALSTLIQAVEGETNNPFEPGIFILILYEGTDAEAFRLGVQDILEFVDGHDDPLSMDMRMSWRNTLLIVTQGWVVGSNEPVPIFAEGESTYHLRGYTGGWYSGVIDNTQVYQAMSEAAFLPTFPKLRPDLPRRPGGGVSLIDSLKQWLGIP